MNRAAVFGGGIVVLLGLVGALALYHHGPSSSAPPPDPQDAVIVCDAILPGVLEALWAYRKEDPAAWDKLLADHAALSLDPKTHLREFHARRRTEDFLRRKRDLLRGERGRVPSFEDRGEILGRIAPYGDGGYIAVVRDNNDEGGDPRRDRDGRLVLSITGILPSGRYAQIETLLRFRAGGTVVERSRRIR